MENLFNRSEHSGAGRPFARVQVAFVHGTPPARSSSKSNALDQGAQRAATMATRPPFSGFILPPLDQSGKPPMRARDAASNPIASPQRLEAILAAPHVAKALQIEPAHPIFQIDCTTYTTSRRPLDHCRFHYHGTFHGVGVRG